MEIRETEVVRNSKAIHKPDSWEVQSVNVTYLTLHVLPEIQTAKAPSQSQWGLRISAIHWTLLLFWDAGATWERDGGIWWVDWNLVEAIVELCS